MVILQVCDKPPYPARDGGSIGISFFTQGYSYLGHTVIVLAMNTPKHFSNQESIKTLLPVNTSIRFIQVDTRIHVILALVNLIFSKKPYHVIRFYSKKFESALSELLQQNKFDRVHLDGLYVATYISTVRKYSDALICYRAHNIEYEIWERIASNEINFFKRFYLRNLAKRIKRFEINIINKYDALIPITLRDSKVFTTFGNSKPMCIIPIGVRINKTIQTSIRNYPSLCYIGALDWIPNQQGLLWFIKHVWPIVISKKPNIKMFIAGRNAPDWLIKIINTNHITFLGEVEDAFNFLNQYAIMVVPLFSGSGMRIKIIEGLSVGKAIVSTTLGAEGIKITNRQNILLADTIEEFANCILELSINKEFFDEICKNALDVVYQYYDDTQIVNNLSNFIENLKYDH